MHSNCAFTPKFMCNFLYKFVCTKCLIEIDVVLFKKKKTRIGVVMAYGAEELFYGMDGGVFIRACAWKKEN